MAKLIRSACGLWVATLRSEKGPCTTKRHRTRQEAERWICRAESGRLADTHRVCAPTVATLMDRYFSEVSPRKKASTQCAEKRRAAPLLAHFGPMSVSEVSPVAVAEYRDRRLATPTSGLGCMGTRRLAPATVRLELALLGHLFTVAAKEWHYPCVGNPVSQTRRPPPSPGRDRRLTRREERQIIVALRRRRNLLLLWAFQLALETALRIGEIRTLTADAVNLRRRVLLLKETKNGSSREVPLSQRATDILQSIMAHPRPPGCGLLFPGAERSDGRRLPYRLEFAWWRAKNELGLIDLHFHDLRHEAISRLVEAGLNDLEVAAISGHRSIQMLKRYTHLRARTLVSRLDKLKFGRR